ncbi:MAG: polyhydroxyalkanoate synthesis regulator phasin [Planctomycetota bacterium]|jgi:polyhydroxyalkanoate synthesis regulator phasin
MEETLKKLVYAGVGLAAQATEKIEETVTDLISKGKISDKEGKKIVDDFFKKSEKKKDSYESKFKSAIEDVTAKFNYISSKDFDALVKRVAKLEKSGSKKTTVAKKTVAKKTTEAKKSVTAAKDAVKDAIKG